MVSHTQPPVSTKLYIDVDSVILIWFTTVQVLLFSQGLVEGIGRIEVFDPNTKALRKLTDAPRQTPTPLSIGLAGSPV